MRRLLRIRELEEEQRRLALEAAAEELRRLEAARAASLRREKSGRALVRASARSGEIVERIAGIEETEMAQVRTGLIVARIEEAEAATDERRREFLEKRVERRQAETLIEENESRERREQERRSQQALDDWHGARLTRRDRAGNAPSAETQKT